MFYVTKQVILIFAIIFNGKTTFTKSHKRKRDKLCYVMLCILYLKSMHKIVYNKKTNKYRLIDATLTPGDQMWSLAAVAAATTYSDEVQATTTATTKNNTVPVWE